MGWGEAARITLPAGADRFTAGQKWLRALFDSADVVDPVDLPGSGPVAFGSFTFDPASDGSVLVVPRAVLGRRDGRAWLTTIGEPAGGALGLLRRRPLTTVSPPATPAEVRWQDGSLSALQWEHAVARAVARIRAGELSKVVLARDQRATAAQPIDVRVLLAQAGVALPGLLHLRLRRAGRRDP